MEIADALRLLRTRQGLTQTAASRGDGAPDDRTLSHWETGRKSPTLRLLRSYLGCHGFDAAETALRADFRSLRALLYGIVRAVKKKAVITGADLDRAVARVEQASEVGEDSRKG